MNPASNQIPGVVMSILITSVILAFPISFFILRKYKNYLIRGMGYKAAKFKQLDDTPPIHSNKQVEFDIEVVPLNKLTSLHSPVYDKLKATLGFHFMALGLSCLAFALFISWCSLYEEGGNVGRYLFSVLIYGFPFFQISMMLLTTTIKDKFILVGLTGMVYLIFATILWGRSHGSDISFLDIFKPIIAINLMPFLMIYLFRIRTIKSIGLLVFTFFIICTAAPFLFLYYLSHHPDVLNYVAGEFIQKGFSGTATFYMIPTLVFLLSIPIGWFILKGIRYLYVTKKLNDLQLNSDAILIIYNLVYAMMMFSGNHRMALVSLGAFPLYKSISFLMYFLLRKNMHQEKVPKLLLLRVFRLGEKSRTLYERICRHWRYAGIIQMISGPDLATSTVDPHEVMAYIGGELRNFFCEDETSIQRNINAVDIKPDIDSTYRVTEFFCRDNNWKEVLKRLVKSNDLVLMDIRKFSPDFKGCQFEIKSLIQYFPIEKIIFIIDQDTQLDFTKSVFLEGFQGVDQTSPNVVPPSKITFYKTDKQTINDADGLLRMLCSKI
ncbi:MAG: hypothetical protein KA198_07290 [Chitinophagaceae bacterium]|nr:hypothetical protein [Chitinophagaceae bacterium]